jgi:hypothetical protein
MTARLNAALRQAERERMTMPVSTDDYVAVADMYGRYNWAVDEGDGDGWAQCFTEDGEFNGALPNNPKGHAQLREVPLASGSPSGPMRHMIQNLYCDYDGDDQDTIIARFYNAVTTWQGEGKWMVNAIVTARLVRTGEGWKINVSDNIMLPRPA